ncbi:TPA: hypothetical protein DCZ46_03530 [Candidatus Campbellbacteria bacterium]|nr:MAG: protein of unknown function with transmembrane region [Candidatus Campbellbacteria bacterium GW2011_OD1_34_28]KKP74798.1 MAG: hypothetical protein UR74_C0002G0064 [Candidatus Campbellbacteria bacterium GW2011_GWD2_35_24]KKP75684.1 MAG: hypothetical protein UR75_C0002G0065 [Candidatus Campbellbacteria bacterium GW2011_GWC2_35_28]KKP77068.1 MAG: hypothetical protein UR76_C0002G0269 [Candidatus Campbellbacteria bacterium GW2011_GWC1_35_31]KKP78994.1 MAG: hypothetical protein UR79_C0002G026
MAEETQEKTPFKQLTSFYFSNNWYSFFTITYLLFFLYSAIFFLDYVFTALKFILYTLGLSTPLLGLNSLFWGIMFVISLVIPFSVSLSAIVVFYDLWAKTKLQIKQKMILSVFIVIIIVTIIVTMDDIIRNVARQPSLNDFIEKSGLIQRI